MNVLVGVIVLAAIVGLILYFTAFKQTTASDVVTLVSDSQRGSQEVSIAYDLPLSFNQAEGIVFAYTGWILVKDFTVGYGTRRRILSKGDAPGIYLDSTSNSLVFAVKTYGTTETILVPDIPAQKWIHFAMVVDQQSVDLYINGILRQHHTLSQLPDQNAEPIVMGPGWEGVLGRVAYHAKPLSATQVKALARETPPDDLNPRPSRPQYFDISWYIGRLNSI